MNSFNSYLIIIIRFHINSIKISKKNQNVQLQLEIELKPIELT